MTKNIDREQLYNKYNFVAAPIEVGDGWLRLVGDMLSELKAIADNPDNPFEVTTIKEKWGSLRVYLSYDTEETDLILKKYEELSTKTCENCGSPGKINNYRGWFTCLCDECKRKHLDKSL